MARQSLGMTVTQNREPEMPKTSHGAEIIPLVERRFPRYQPVFDARAAVDANQAKAALTRAELRIAQLEQSLAQALRDSALNWARARRAERRLAEEKTLEPTA